MAGPRRSPNRLSDQTAEQIADTMFALSTPSRLQILGCLRAGPRTVSEIVEAVEMEQSAVSHQLRVLRDHFRPEFLNRVDDIVVFRPLEE